MQVWFNENIVFYYLSEINGLMLSSFSEFLAFLPYLLRSLRMQLMFKATDEYIKTDKMPKRQIRFWSENVLLCIVLVLVSTYTALIFIFHYTDI